MNGLKNTIFLSICAIKLDYAILRDDQLSIISRLELIIKKYILLIKHRISPFKLGHSWANINNRKIFYETAQGLLFYQNIMVKTKRLVQHARLPDQPVIVDIGANVGLFSLLINKLYPQSTIFAVEPIMQNFLALQKNTRHIPKMVAKQQAISDKNGTIKMSFDKNFGTLSTIDSAGKEEVHTITLDDFVSEHEIKKIDLLKIDTEQHELNVLRKAHQALKKTKYLVIEIAFENNMQYTISQLLSHLYSDDYNFQLRAFRNFDIKHEGSVRIWDCLFENCMYEEKNH